MNTSKIFVYGTLKRNQPNHHLLTERNAVFIDEAITVDKWPLIIETNANIPFLLYKNGIGYNIHGEIFTIDKETLDYLDDFEGVEQDIYKRKLITVKSKQSDQIEEIFCYVFDNFRSNLVNDSTLFMESYDTNNRFNRPYVKFRDTTDSTDNLVKHMKQQ